MKSATAAGGRPTKRTPEAQAVICEALTKGYTRRAAAAAAGMTYQTLREWEKDDAEFSDAIEKAEGILVGRLVDQILADKSWQAKAWVLERRYPTEFSQRQHVEMTGKDGGPIEQHITDGLEDHEKALLRQAIVDELARRADPRPEESAVGTAGEGGPATPTG